MPNVQGTPMTGMFVGQPQGNPLADAFGALASSMAARRKYDMDQQHALRAAVAPQLAAGLQLQPPAGAGADIQGLMAMLGGNQNQMSGGPWNMFGTPQAPAQSGAPSWGIGVNPKAEQDAAKVASDIERNTVQNQADRFKMSPEGYAMGVSSNIYEAAAKNPFLKWETDSANALKKSAQDAYSTMLELGQNNETMMEIARKFKEESLKASPTQPKPAKGKKEYTLEEIKKIAAENDSTVDEVLAFMKQNGIKLAQ